MVAAYVNFCKLGLFGGHRGPILGHLLAHLGPSWGHIGNFAAILGPSWGHLGAILAHLWSILAHLKNPLGPFENHIGPWRGYLGPTWKHLGPCWGYLGPSCDHLGADESMTIIDFAIVFAYVNFCKLWRLWGHIIGLNIGQTWRQLGPCWVILGASWGHIGHIAAILGPHSHIRPHWPNFLKQLLNIYAHIRKNN
jgi:hypothetical protein